MGKYRTLSHNPFSRQSLVRRTVFAVASRRLFLECSWCGGKGQHAYEYGIDKDDRPYQPNWYKGMFCCKSCFTSYHDLPSRNR